MSKPLSMAVSELTIRDGYGRVSKRYRMVRSNDIIKCLMTVSESSNEKHTQENIRKVIDMILDLNPNV
ncbi:hypothetical protein SEA_BILLNYE_233 [Streptomyces phage BillNye]|uniref:Uncharacterized protein n=2 Tax=Wilnyevirus billnye TaxID=2560486 RepID=A0A2L1IW53_9CAUD|nr:hypothetical protein FDJ30_gp029 [Streptomyces phage BillNye]AVD99404.1 hypothetical protein SEA_BILLNYE_233 [Streptomyces phage BillNye]QBZ72486.1 hypothetical protein SEA_CIRCINUS_233 [Streptomyces phage Circinus]